ncbi:nudix hydrolase 20, chloroplastic-like [Salvia splendens]|uniref:nudix hydrolase 20, chloroplastic-like n=1 Tax=Salvia splendens TaxID=180675 RepID=UPI001C266448|nr:nudix hydrolase 20, chloroplastic-like [Salvia splendens]
MKNTIGKMAVTLCPSFGIRRWGVNLPYHPPLQSAVSAQYTVAGSSSFTWNDVVGLTPKHDSSDLRGFFPQVALCNRNSENMCEFMPFVIEEQVVGYVHHGFADHLRTFKDVFIFPEGSSYDSNFRFHLTLHPLLSTPEDRTKAVADVVKCFANKLIPGIRNELYPVTSSFGTPEFFSLERAAAPYFGIKAYGIHLNGYVEGEKQDYLWVGKRSNTKSKYPGQLDHLVAGGLPHGISCTENVVKECKEEAGIPRSISSKAKAVGAVTYSDIDGYRFNRDVLFCYDLKLPEDFLPTNEDGEVESFRLLPVELVANIIKSTQYYKANCNLVIIDFLFRHGYIKPEAPGYLKLLQSLRSGECT